MSFARSLSHKHLLCCLRDLLLSRLDVALCRLDGRVTNKIFRRHDILSSLVVVGRLRDSEVVTLDVQPVLLKEPFNLHDPFAGLVMALAWWEHFVFVLCIDLLLVGHYGIDCVLVHKDGPPGRLLSNQLELAEAFLVNP